MHRTAKQKESLSVLALQRTVERKQERTFLRLPTPLPWMLAKSADRPSPPPLGRAGGGGGGAEPPDGGGGGGGGGGAPP